MSKKEDIEKKKKQDEEDLKRLLDDFKEKNNISKEDIEKLGSLLHTAFIEAKYSKKFKFFKMVKEIFIKLGLFYLVSLICFGFFISYVTINYSYMFIALAIISLLLTLFEILPRFSKKRYSISYLLLFVLIMIDLCLFNNIYPIFTHSYVWFLYIIGMELGYMMLLTQIVKFKVFS